MDIKDKKKQIIAYLVKYMGMLDPSGNNSKRYKKLLDPMSVKQFDEFMLLVKDGKFQIHLNMPNMKENLEMNNIFKTADAVSCKLFHKIWLKDPATNTTYLTDKTYPVFNLPIRRQQQYLEEKMGVETASTTQTDLLTGQVTGDSRASSITQPEINTLHAKGLNTTLHELVKIRGGDLNAYGEFKRQLEETGECSLESIDPNSRARSGVILKALLRGAHLELNV